MIDGWFLGLGGLDSSALVASELRENPARKPSIASPFGLSQTAAKNYNCQTLQSMISEYQPLVAIRWLTRGGYMVKAPLLVAHTTYRVAYQQPSQSRANKWADDKPCWLVVVVGPTMPGLLETIGAIQP